MKNNNEFHEIADIFPEGTENYIESLSEMYKTFGFIGKAYTKDGKIVDKTVQTAVDKAGIKIELEEFEGDDLDLLTNQLTAIHKDEHSADVKACITVNAEPYFQKKVQKRKSLKCSLSRQKLEYPESIRDTRSSRSMVCSMAGVKEHHHARTKKLKEKNISLFYDVFNRKLKLKEAEIKLEDINTQKVMEKYQTEYDNAPNGIIDDIKEFTGRNKKIKTWKVLDIYLYNRNFHTEYTHEERAKIRGKQKKRPIRMLSMPDGSPLIHNVIFDFLLADGEEFTPDQEGNFPILTLTSYNLKFEEGNWCLRQTDETQPQQSEQAENDDKIIQMEQHELIEVPEVEGHPTQGFEAEIEVSQSKQESSSIDKQFPEQQYMELPEQRRNILKKLHENNRIKKNKRVKMKIAQLEFEFDESHSTELKLPEAIEFLETSLNTTDYCIRLIDNWGKNHSRSEKEEKVIKMMKNQRDAILDDLKYKIIYENDKEK